MQKSDGVHLLERVEDAVAGRESGGGGDDARRTDGFDAAPAAGTERATRQQLWRALREALEFLDGASLSRAPKLLIECVTFLLASALLWRAVTREAA